MRGLRRKRDSVNRADFIPDVIWTYDEDGWAIPVNRHDNPRKWHGLVDSESWVITQVDDGKLPDGKGLIPTSSSSALDVMALMLNLLDVQTGMNVLEIGAGTGYNAALIAQQVTPGRVTTIEVDEEIAEHARRALHRTGLPVSVITGDGAVGYPDNAPYQRIICTASALHVPYAWVEQTQPGGKIVLPFVGGFGRGAFLGLTTEKDGCAHGRFHDGASFMRLRNQRDDKPLWRVFSPESAAYYDEDLGDISVTTTRSLHTEPFTEFAAAFALGLLLPGWNVGLRPLDGVVLLSHAASGSWATILPGDDEHRVYHQGPRRLWEDLDAAYRWWLDLDRPDNTRFGLTVTPTGQAPWLDSPGNTLAPIGEPAS